MAKYNIWKKKYLHFTVRSNSKAIIAKKQKKKTTKSISISFHSPFFFFFFIYDSVVFFVFIPHVTKTSYVATLLIKLIPSNEIRNPSAHTNNITSSLTEKIKITYSIQTNTLWCIHVFLLFICRKGELFFSFIPPKSLQAII